MREEENKRSSQGSRFKRLFKKRWVFPAIYIASAAIILTGVLWYQNSNIAKDKYDYKSTDITGKKSNPPAIVVNKALENFKMPVAKPLEAVVKMKFYDNKASDEDQEAALVFYNNTFHQNKGIDFAMKDGESFDVVAALSGKVTKVEEDAILGNVIEIEHDKGIVTQYQSVKEMKVKVGDQVKQGQVLAKAGQSLFNEEAGTHVHFEVRKDGVAVNPTTVFNKSISVLQTDDQTESKNDEKQRIEDPDSSDEEEDAESEGGSSKSNEKTNS